MAHLAEAGGFIRGFVSLTPSRNGDSGQCINPGLLEGPPLTKARCDLSTEGRLSRKTLATRVEERCAKANQPSVFGPKRSWACTSTA